MIKEFQRRNNFDEIHVQGKDGNTIILLLPVSTVNESFIPAIIHNRLSNMLMRMKPYGFAPSKTMNKPVIK